MSNDDIKNEEVNDGQGDAFGLICIIAIIANKAVDGFKRRDKDPNATIRCFMDKDYIESIKGLFREEKDPDLKILSDNLESLLRVADRVSVSG